MTALTLPDDITPTGVSEGSLVNLLTNIVAVVNELQTNHDTFKTEADDSKALVNQLRQSRLYGAYGNPGFAIDTNFDVKNATAIYYTNGGTLKTFAANTSFDTGTTKTVTGSKFAAALLSISATGTAILTWTSGGAYNSEAAAIAALPACATTETPVGYFTLQAHASGFTAGTDALTTGTGGNVCTATTYYNSINPNVLMIGAAVSSSAPAALVNSTALHLTKG
jgi:hypothetical protein